MASPELPAVAANRTFIKTTAQLSLAMAALSVLWSAGQLLTMLLANALNWFATLPLDIMPPLMVWLIQHGVALSMLLLLASLAFLVVSWGMLRYYDWGRIGFIVFLIAIAVINFAFLPAIDHVMTYNDTLFAASDITPEGREYLAQFKMVRRMILLIVGATMVVIAVAHAWLAWKLNRPAIRALFR